MTGWGALIDLGEGNRGLLHVDQMNWPEGAVSPSAYDCMKEGDEVEVSRHAVIGAVESDHSFLYRPVCEGFLCLWLRRGA